MLTRIPTTDGICTGRNGTVCIKAVEVADFGNLIRIDGISQRRGVCLNAGLSFDFACAEQLGNAILNLVKQHKAKNSP